MSSPSATAHSGPPRSAHTRLSGAGTRLLADTPVGVREVGLCGLFLLLLGFAVFGVHVADGNRYWADDWYHTRLVAQADGPSFWDTVNPQTAEFRPLLVTLIALPYHVLGLEPAWHLGLAVVLAAGASLSFYWLLRVLGIAALHAGLVAALILLFPWSDSSRLWTTGSILNVALILYFVGTALGLLAFRREGWRAVALIAGAVSCYVMSIITYEIVAAAEVASVLLYARYAGWRPALRRWPLDLLAIGVTLRFVYVHIPERYKTETTPRAVAGHGRDMADESLTLLQTSLFPGVFSGRVLGLLVIAAVLVGAGVLWRRLAPEDETRRTLLRWFAFAAAGALLISAGYAAFVPGKSTYLPSNPGVGNRVNLLAGFGFVMVAYAVLMLAGTLVARATSRGPGLAAALAAAASVAIGAGYIVILGGDIRNWDRAADLQRQELAVIGRVVPPLLADVRANGPAGPGKPSVYAFGWPTYTAPSVPVFALRTDLRDGVRLTLDDPRVTAQPVRRTEQFQTRWFCERRYMFPKDISMDIAEGAPYGRGIFVDIPTGRGVIPRNQAECLRYARAFGHPAIASKSNVRGPT